MRIRYLRRLPAVAALAVAAVALAACGAGPATALPVQPPNGPPISSPSGTPGGPPSGTPDAAPTGPSTRPARPPKPVHTNNDPPCLGAVVYRIDAAAAGPATQRLCIAVGAVVRVENLGPEGFSVSPSGSVECFYEAGVRLCRLVEPGSVRFTTDNGRQVRTITVDVTRRWPATGPACVAPGGTHTVDASENGPPWFAVCLKVGAQLRVENLGPGDLAVTPSRAMSCRYEAGIHQCRVVRTGTIRVVTDGAGGVRPLTVVAVR
jgi:hypothetical protein